MIVIKNLDELVAKLNQGEGDLLVNSLSITGNSKKSVSFANYLYLTKQALVQKNEIIGVPYIGTNWKI
jgi:membrane-bound lytic murein transglycosylase F